MDNNIFQENNNQGGFKLNSETSGQNAEYPAQGSQGYDSQTFGTTMSGTYDSTIPPTFEDNTYNNVYATSESPFEDVYAKKAKTGMILGIINMVLNLIFCCMPFMLDIMFSPGWLFIALEVWGMNASKQGQQSVTKSGMAKAGKIMNIISLVCSILMIVIVLVLKFADILS